MYKKGVSKYDFVILSAAKKRVRRPKGLKAISQNRWQSPLLDASHALPLAPTGGELRFSMTKNNGKRVCREL